MRERKVYDVTDLRDITARRFQLEDGQMAVSTVQLGKRICEALDAPEGTQQITIDLGVDDVVSVTYRTMVSMKKLRRLGFALSDSRDECAAT